MKRYFSARTIALLMALALVFTMAACGKSTPEQKPSSTIPPIINLLPDAEAPEAPTGPVEPSEDVLKKIDEKFKINTDVKGWINIPGTTIDREVVQYANDKQEIATTGKPFYERKNLNKEYDFNGLYWADYDNTVGGDRDDMTVNTILYGHSMSDDPNGADFSQLKQWRNIEFAKKHPYFTYSTTIDSMTFEIFAVVETEVDYGWYIYADGKVPKLNGLPNGMTYQQVLEKLQNQSLWDYEDIEVTTDDKIMVLSTCTYPDGNLNSSYNHRYKYLIVGRLIEGEGDKEEVKLVENKDRLISPGR